MTLTDGERGMREHGGNAMNGLDECADELEERDAAGELTDWALAGRAMSERGCYCTDESSPCLGCLCERAMRTERRRAKLAETQLADAVSAAQSLAVALTRARDDALEALAAEHERLLIVYRSRAIQLARAKRAETRLANAIRAARRWSERARQARTEAARWREEKLVAEFDAAARTVRERMRRRRG